MAQKDLDRWLVNAFSGINNLMRRRALDPTAGPVPELVMDELRALPIILGVFLEKLPVGSEDPGSADNQLVGLYYKVLSLLEIRQLQASQFDPEIVKYLEMTKKEIEKIVQGYEALNRRYKDGTLNLKKDRIETELQIVRPGKQDSLSATQAAWLAEEKFVVLTPGELAGQSMNRSELLKLGYYRFWIIWDTKKNLYFRLLESNQKADFEKLI